MPYRPLWALRLHRVWAACVSGFIALVLVCQTYAIPAQILGKPIDGYYWPFMDYPMYATARREGDPITYEYHLEFEFEDLTRVRVKPADVDLSFWHFHRRATRVAAGQRSALQELISLYDAPAGVTVVRVYTPPLIVTQQGSATAPRRLLAEVRLVSDTEDRFDARP